MYGVSVQFHAPYALPPGKDMVPILQKYVWAVGPAWTGVENLAPLPLEFDPRTLHPVASHYTDWAIQTHT